MFNILLTQLHQKKWKTNTDGAMAVVVERSKASYLIDVLGMLKVKGSSLAISCSFFEQENSRVRFN